MPSVHLDSLPSLVAAILVPLVGVTTLFIERGSRRGLGMAGFLLLFGAAAVPKFLMHSAAPEGPPPEAASRWALALGTLAYAPMIEFLGDLARRSGAQRPLGVPLRAGQWILRAQVLLGVPLVLLGDEVLAGVRYEPATGWGHIWGPGWPLFVTGGLVFVAWGVACWNGERRRLCAVDRDLYAWLAALLLLVAMPVIAGTALPAANIAETHAWTPAFTVLGAIATLVGLVLSRDRELERLRPVTPAGATAATGARRASTGSGGTALCCASCGAAFRSLPEEEVCPIDGGAVGSGPDPIAGLLVDGRYRVLRFLGAGGMARVYAAEHDRLGVRVALKVLWGDLAADHAMTRRFLREARAASALDSPHIVRVRDVGQVSEGLPYMAMELVEGVSLGDRIDREGPQRMESVALLGAQLAAGLRAAHAAGVVHRDLKPDNVMIVRGADRDTAKIVDFGLAKLVGLGRESARLTVTGAVFGTPLYMAPEQIGGREVGPSADFYALGVLLYEAACGAPPFTASTPVQVMVKHLQAEPERPPLDGPIGAPLAALIMSLLVKDPDERASAAEDLEARFAALAGEARRFEPCGRRGAGPPPAAPLDETVPDAPPRA